MAAHNEIILYTLSGTALMYLPITTVFEQNWQNALTVSPKPWDRGGPHVVDVKMWAGEVVLQGSFISSDAPADPDFITALRSLPGMPVAPTVITADMQYDYLQDKVITTNEFWLHINNRDYKYASGSVDISAGKYPPATPKEIRILAEGSKDELVWTMRCVIGQVRLRRT